MTYPVGAAIDLIIGKHYCGISENLWLGSAVQIEFLETFVEVARLGSVTRAAEASTYPSRR
jgi:hypothetical protein